MADDRDNLMHEVLNSTGGIYWIMKPYHKTHQIDDQHWAYLCVCLKRIEKACKARCEGDKDA